MCRIDDCDTWKWFRSEKRKARKEHVCTECWRTISPGETYEFATGQIDDSTFRYRTCPNCMAVREWLIKVCSGWAFEMVKEEMNEHFREGYGIWLGRAAVGMERKWQRFDGAGLMPPMALPAVLPTGSHP